MIKKESFEALISSLKFQLELERKLSLDLGQYFDGYLISKITEDFRETVIKVLEQEMNDPEIDSGMVR